MSAADEIHPMAKDPVPELEPIQETKPVQEPILELFLEAVCDGALSAQPASGGVKSDSVPNRSQFA